MLTNTRRRYRPCHPAANLPRFSVVMGLLEARQDPPVLFQPAMPVLSSRSGCLCSLEERALRHCIAGKATLTAEQHKYCHDQIVAVEGYSDSDTEGSDADVANSVLRAWTDYCRDKGIL